MYLSFNTKVQNKEKYYSIMKVNQMFLIGRKVLVYTTKGKVVKNMRNLLILVIIVICLIQVNGNFFRDISHSNIVFANSTNSREANIPIIDRNIPSNIKTATFAMG